MISKEQATNMVWEYELKEQVRKQNLEVEIQKRTIEWCDNELSSMIEENANKGMHHVDIPTSNVYIDGHRAPRNCTAQLQKSTYFFKVRELHVPTFLEYVKQHGYTVSQNHTEFRLEPSGSKIIGGRFYTVEW